MGNSYDGLYDVISLATPTIPPMTRSPVSHVITAKLLYLFNTIPVSTEKILNNFFCGTKLQKLNKYRIFMNIKEAYKFHFICTYFI